MSFGATGARGATGATGARGATGPRGARGAREVIDNASRAINLLEAGSTEAEQVALKEIA